MRSIQMLYRAAIFTFTPTALELAFVCGVLAKAFSPLVGGLVLATFAAYVTWSIVMTSVRRGARLGGLGVSLLPGTRLPACRGAGGGRRGAGSHRGRGGFGGGGSWGRVHGAVHAPVP